MKKELGRYLIDISKLTFAGVVLSVILDISESKILVLALGGVATLVFAVAGFVFLTKIKNKGE